jgi:hypothetical protein
MEAVRASETPVNFYQTSQRHISKDIILQQRHYLGLLFTKLYEDNGVKEDEMGGARRNMREIRTAYEIWVGRHERNRSSKCR